MNPKLISFVIPAHNEEMLLPRTVASIKNAMEGIGVAFEILVVDDASTDHTAEVALSQGAQVVNVNLRQISAVRNAGARVSKGELLVFVDADTKVTHNVMKAMLQAISSGAIAGGCAVEFDGKIPMWAKLAETVVRYGYRIVRMAAGCFLFSTREAFFSIGGFDEGVFAGEEAFISFRLKKQGRFVVLRESVITSGRKLRTYSGFEIASILGKLAMLGRKGVADRKHLDLWYGTRRNDLNLTETEKPEVDN